MKQDNKEKQLIVQICNSFNSQLITYGKVRAYGSEKKLEEYVYQKYAWKLHRQDLAEISPNRNFAVTQN